MVQVYYEEAERSLQGKGPKDEVVGNSSGTAHVKDPLGHEGMTVEIESALEGRSQEAERSLQGKGPKDEVVGNSSGTAHVKDPLGHEGMTVEIESALEGRSQEAERSLQGKGPKDEVVGNSSGTAHVKDPLGHEGMTVEIESALEGRSQEAERSLQGKGPKDEVVGNSSGTAHVKDPLGHEGMTVEIESALEGRSQYNGMGRLDSNSKIELTSYESAILPTIAALMASRFLVLEQGIQVEVAPPKKLKLSTRRTKSVATTSSSTSRLANKTPVPLSITGGTFTTPDWLPDGLTMVVSAKATGQKFKVELAPPQKEQVFTTSTKPLEIPERLYDLIQNAARVRKSLKLNSNNRSAKRKLESLESDIHVVSTCCKFITEDLPTDWIYDPETSMAHVPKPPTSPKPKTEKKKKKTTKEIQITWSSPNYHGKYPLKNDELEVWNLFRRTENAEAQAHMVAGVGKDLNMVDKDDMVIPLLGKFAVDTYFDLEGSYTKVVHFAIIYTIKASLAILQFCTLTSNNLVAVDDTRPPARSRPKSLAQPFTTLVTCNMASRGRRSLPSILLPDLRPPPRPRPKPHDLNFHHHNVHTVLLLHYLLVLITTPLPINVIL
ncbi:hypothetical protein Tco_1304465 [Tanacetum coccineum]